MSDGVCAGPFGTHASGVLARTNLGTPEACVPTSLVLVKLCQNAPGSYTVLAPVIWTLADVP